MNCPACTAAELAPIRHDYTNGCDGCQARAIAALGMHRESIEAGKVSDDLKRVLAKLFADPAQGWKLVREWGPKVDQARKVRT